VKYIGVGHGWSLVSGVWKVKEGRSRPLEIAYTL